MKWQPNKGRLKIQTRAARFAASKTNLGAKK